MDRRTELAQSVVTGTDEWLFHRDCAVFEQLTGLRALTDRELRNWRELIEERREWIEGYGCRYYVYVPPEKHVVYADKLKSFVVSDHRPVRQLATALDGCGVDLIYPLEPLLAGRATRETYFVNDTHWNMFGSYIGYRELCRVLGRHHTLVEVPESRLEYFEREHQGDLGVRLEPERVAPGVFYVLREPRARIVRDNGVFSRGNVSVWEQPNRTLPRVVLFRDSFANQILPLLAESASRVVAVSSMEAYPELLEVERPDIVITEIAERYLNLPSGPNGEGYFPDDLQAPPFEKLCRLSCQEVRAWSLFPSAELKQPIQASSTKFADAEASSEKARDNRQYLLALRTARTKRTRLEEAIFPRLACVRCGSAALGLRSESIVCSECSQVFPIVDSIPLMTTDPDAALRGRENEIVATPYSEQWMTQIERAGDGWVLDLVTGNNPVTHERVIKFDILALPSVDVVGRAECLPFADRTFKSVISSGAFKHFPDPFRAIQQVFRVLCDDGEIYVETAFLQPAHVFPDHYYNTTLHGLEHLCSTFERLDSGVRRHQTPSFTLRWILQAWAAKLPEFDRHQFLNTTVSEIIGEYERDPFSQRWMAGFSSDDMAELAAGVYFHGRKRPR